MYVYLSLNQTLRTQCFFLFLRPSSVLPILEAVTAELILFTEPLEAFLRKIEEEATLDIPVEIVTRFSKNGLRPKIKNFCVTAMISHPKISEYNKYGKKTA